MAVSTIVSYLIMTAISTAIGLLQQRSEEQKANKLNAIRNHAQALFSSGQATQAQAEALIERMSGLTNTIPGMGRKLDELRKSVAKHFINSTSSLKGIDSTEEGEIEAAKDRVAQNNRNLEENIKAFEDARFKRPGRLQSEKEINNNG